MLHVIYGKDSFARREVLAELRASLDEDGALATNMVTLRAADTSPQEVIAACSTAPFLGSHRLVILEGALKLQEGAKQGRRKSSPDGTAAASAWAPLVEFAAALPETTVLVLVDGDVSRDNPLLESLKPMLPTLHPCTPPGPKELAGWVQARARKLEIRLDARAAQRLAQLVGGQEDRPGSEYVDTWSLASELDKLAAYANGEVVREEHVLALSPNLRDQKGYFLCDAIVERRPAAAAKIVAELLEQGEPVQLILGTIAGRFRRLAIARDMLDSGASGEAVRKELAAKPGYGFDKLLEQAGGYSLDDVRALYELTVEADFAHKSGLSDEGPALDVLVQELASFGGTARPRSA